MSDHLVRALGLDVLEETLHRLTAQPHIVATIAAATIDPAHVEKIVDDRLMHHQRQQEITDRMNWK